MKIETLVTLSNVGRSPARLIKVVQHVVTPSDGFNIQGYREDFIERCRRHQDGEPVSILFPDTPETPRPLSLITGDLRTMAAVAGGKELLWPYLFISVVYKTAIDSKIGFSFYTYLVRKGVSGTSDKTGFPIGEDVPLGLVQIIPDEQRFGPVAE